MFPELHGADGPATGRTGLPSLPTRVVERTREQLRSYLGQMELKGNALRDFGFTVSKELEVERAFD